MFNILMGIPEIILIVIILIFTTILVVVYSNLAHYELLTLRNKVDQIWLSIKIPLDTKYSLLKELIEEVKISENISKDTINKLKKARLEFKAAIDLNLVKKLAYANEHLNEVLSLLKEEAQNEKIISILSKLDEQEEKLLANKKDYNSSVLSYTRLTKLFPSLIIARMGRFKARDFYAINLEEQRED